MSENNEKLLESEVGTLSCLIRYNDLFEHASINLKEEDYVKLENKVIFNIIIDLYNNNYPIDIVTIKSKLQTYKVEADIEFIINEVFPRSSYYEYFEHLRNNRINKEIENSLKNTIEKCYSIDANPTEIVSTLNNIIIKTRKDYDNKYEIKSISNLVDIEIDKIEDQILNKGKQGLLSGIRGLDEKINLIPSELTIIAARPSVGKTSLALTVINNLILKDIPCVFFSLEMPAKAINYRLIEMVSGFSIKEITENPTNQNVQSFSKACLLLKDKPLFIDDTSGIDIDDLIYRLSYMIKDHGIKFAAIDYLQLITSKSERAKRSRNAEIDEISSKLKNATKDLSIPILALAQLNRVDIGKKPSLSNLRESGSIEQDADNIGLLTREGQDAILNIAKNRNGPTGEITLKFKGNTKEFYEE